MKVVIAGGGLVGSLCASMLGKRGHQIDVYEVRPDPKTSEGNQTQGRSINLALSTRGRASLKFLGLEDLVISQAIPLKGRLIHNLDGSKNEHIYDLIGNDCIYSINRSYLNEVLVNEAVQHPNVNFHYGHKILQADLDKGILTLRKSKENEIIVHADLLIGADGAHSSIRNSLLRKPRTNFCQKYIEHGYLQLNISPKENGLHAMEKNYLHIWPRSSFMLIALPNMDGTFTGTLFMPFDIYDELNSTERIEALFENNFADVIDLIGRKLLVETILNNKLSYLLSIQCNPFHSGRGVLIGDAAHAMVPFYGQGMNAGFEDVLIFDEILNRSEIIGVEKCLAEFSAIRSKDAVAICELAMDHYLEMRHLVNERGFYLRRILDTICHKIMGAGWIPLYNNVTFSRLPYSQCISHRKWQDEILKAAGRYTGLVISGCVLTAAFYWRNVQLFQSSGK